MAANILHSMVGDTSVKLSDHSVRGSKNTQTNLDKPTGVGDHCLATGHSVSMDNMSRDQGYHLPATYNQTNYPRET